MAKKKLKNVRCISCGKIIGKDSSVTRIESCSRCTSSNKKRTVKTASSSFARTKKGPAEDLPSPLDQIYFRSGWERNFARALTAQGKDWSYERVSFTFSCSPTTGKPYTRKPWVYIPDFYDKDEDVLWEVKGYLLSADRSKMRRLKANYPDAFKKMKACLSKGNKKAISFYQKMGIPCIFIEDLNKEWKDKIPQWE